jgi:hypothetical protein
LTTLLFIGVENANNHHHQFTLCEAQLQQSYHQCWLDNKIIMTKIIREVLILQHRWVEM